MRLPIGIGFAALLCAPAFGDDNPFAVAPQAGAPSTRAYEARLSDIMQLIQRKHVKLWQAGSASDWQLAAFEVGDIRDTFYRASMVYSNIPLADVLPVEKPLTDMDQAIRTRDKTGFSVAYGSLTKACNGCHQAAHVGFIVIRTPDARSLSDQTF